METIYCHDFIIFVSDIFLEQKHINGDGIFIELN